MTERRLPAKADADQREGSSVDGDGGGQGDIGMFEGRHLRFPIVRIEFDKDGSQYGRVVECGIWIMVGLLKCHFGTRPARFSGGSASSAWSSSAPQFTTESSAWTASSARTASAPSGPTAISEGGQRPFSFICVEIPICILVEFGRQLHLWAVGAHSSTGSATGTARKAWQQLFECQCAVAIAIQAAQDLWCTAHFGSRNFTIPVGVEREGQGGRGRAKLGFETVAVIRWLGRARTDKQCGQA